MSTKISNTATLVIIAVACGIAYVVYTKRNKSESYDTTPTDKKCLNDCRMKWMAPPHLYCSNICSTNDCLTKCFAQLITPEYENRYKTCENKCISPSNISRRSGLRATYDSSTSSCCDACKYNLGVCLKECNGAPHPCADGCYKTAASCENSCEGC